MNSLHKVRQFTDVQESTAYLLNGNQEPRFSYVSKETPDEFSPYISLDIICFDETMNISVKIFLRNCGLVIDARYSLFPQSSFHGFITNRLNDLLPLLAQFAERCTGITLVKGPTPVQYCTFSLCPQSQLQ